MNRSLDVRDLGGSKVHSFVPPSFGVDVHADQNRQAGTCVGPDLFHPTGGQFKRERLFKECREYEGSAADWCATAA